MITVEILGHAVEVDFLVGEAAKETLEPERQAEILDRMDEMVALINHGVLDWSAPQARAFRAMKKIVFFEGTVEVNGWHVDRPALDDDDAIFYWEATEFLDCADAGSRGHIFFHDCCHEIQFQDFKRAKGSGAELLDELVKREEEALDQQIGVATALGCGAHDINHLVKFRNDRQAIIDRLFSGVTLDPSPDDN